MRNVTCSESDRSGDAHDLSPWQSAVLNQEIRNPGSRQHHIDLAWLVRGALNVAALEAAWYRIVDRHEALRTVICTCAPAARQLVCAPDRSSFTFARPEELGAPHEPDALAEWVRQLESRRLTDPLARLSAYQCSDDVYLVHLYAHHIITDGASTGILLREIVEFYAEETAGLRHERPAPAQHSTYCATVHREMKRTADRSTRYWSARLAGIESTAGLLNYRRTGLREKTEAVASEPVQVRLDETLASHVLEFSKACGTTPFTVYAAAFQCLLARYETTQDVVVATPVADRSTLNHRDMVGFGVSTVLLRSSPLRAESFAALCHASSQDLQDAAAHRHVDYHDLARMPAVDSGHGTATEIAFAFESASWRELRLPGVECAFIDTLPRPSYFDLTVTIRRDQDGWAAAFAYNASQFSAPLVRRLAGHYANVLRTCLQKPSDPVRGLLAEAVDEQEVLQRFNETSVPFDRRSVPDRVWGHAQENPDAMAVVDADRTLTYGELFVEAQAIALRLTALGVSHGDRVGICVPRSAEFVVGCVAVWMCGAAFLPIDLASPADRKRYMLRDAGVRALIAAETAGEDLEDEQWTILRLPLGEPLSSVTATAPIRKFPASLPCSEDTAYLIYTSGSTGLPKAVVIRHAGLANLVQWHVDRYRVTASDRASAVAGFAFDASVWEIWPHLSAGASVSICTDKARADPVDLCRWLVDRRISIAFMPTPLAEVVMGMSEAAQLPLRYLLTGGDRLKRRPRPGAPFMLVNHYGPTEGTVVATAGVVPEESGDPTASHAMPAIGRPIANVRAYVVNEDSELAPVGGVGELWLSGPGIAVGYHNRPELTGERFLRNPFCVDADHGVAYRTGDLVRWTEGGELEFVGRNDGQVKIRGYRVEPGEIEAQLMALPHVREAAVVAVSGSSARLVAFVATDDATESSALRNVLTQRLPGYMVPSQYLLVDRLPVTANGKVDRSALQGLMTGADSRSADQRKQVRGPDERLHVMSTAWREVLGLTSATPSDNFIDLGGDSITAIQVSSRVRDSGWTLSPSALLQAEDLAAAAEGMSRDRARSQTRARVGAVGKVALTPIQRWLIDVNGGQVPTFVQSVVLHVPPDTNAARLDGALQSVVRHHDALRLRFRKRGDQWEATCLAYRAQSVLTEGSRDHRVSDNKVVERLAQDLAPSEGRLLRAHLVHSNRSERDRLVVVVHHLAVDAVSWRVLLEDLGAAYLALAADRPVMLPRRTSSFREWSLALASFASSPRVELDRPMWERIEKQIRPVLTSAYDGNVARRTRRIRFGELETDRILQPRPRADLRPNELLVSALAQTVGKLTGARDVPIQLEGHGREDISPELDVSRTVGWFTAAFPIVVRTVEQDDVAVLAAVREYLRSLRLHGLTYGLFRHSQPTPAGSTRQAAQPQISFNYLARVSQAMKSVASPFTLVDGLRGDQRAGNHKSPHLLDVAAFVVDGRMIVDVTYQDTPAVREFAEQLGNELPTVVRRLARLAAAGNMCAPGVIADPIAVHERPASPLQHGMLLESARRPAASLYLIQQVYRVVGQQPDARLLERAWGVVIERHLGMRAFVSQDLADPDLAIRYADSVTLPFATHDWRDQDEDPDEPRLGLLLQQRLEAGFDLKRPPLMRVDLVDWRESTWLIWQFHHLVLDGWSTDIVLRDVCLAYDELARGGQVSRLSLQRQILDVPDPVPVRPESLRYWQGLLEGAEPALLGSTGTVGAEFSARVTSLPLSLVTGLEGLARSERTTHSAIICAAWTVVLSLLSRGHDATFAVAVSGRAGLEHPESAVGMFVNSVPMRLRFAAGDSFLTLVRSAQDQQLARAAHEAVGIGVAVRQGGFRQAPYLLNTMVAVENYPPATDAGAMVLEPVPGVTKERTGYAAVLAVTPGAQWKLHLLTDSTSIDAAAAADLLDLTTTVLQKLLVDASSPVTLVMQELAASPELNRLARAHVHRRPQAEVPRQFSVATALEEQIAAVWRRALRVQDVAPYDNFFDLGGDSILAMTAVEELRQWGIGCDVEQLFSNPTAADLAAALAAG